MLNERNIDVASAVLKPGDKISLREKSSKLEYFKMLRQAEESRTPPTWVESDLNNLSGRVIRLPERAEIDGNLNEQLIVEFYSR
jgi:small subunit ribosomal protein S4